MKKKLEIALDIILIILLTISIVTSFNGSAEAAEPSKWKDYDAYVHTWEEVHNDFRLIGNDMTYQMGILREQLMHGGGDTFWKIQYCGDALRSITNRWSYENGVNDTVKSLRDGGHLTDAEYAKWVNSANDQTPKEE